MNEVSKENVLARFMGKAVVIDRTLGTMARVRWAASASFFWVALVELDSF